MSFTNNIACFSQTTPTKTERRTLKKHSSTPSTLKLVGNANPNANTASFCKAVELESFVALYQNLEPSSILFFFFFFRLLQPVPRWPPSLLLRAPPYFQGTHTLSLSLTYSRSKCRLLLFVLLMIIQGGIVRVQGDEFWHMTKVLRLRTNDRYLTPHQLHQFDFMLNEQIGIGLR